MANIEVFESFFEELPEKKMPVSNTSRVISDIARSPRRGVRQLQEYSFEELKRSIEEIHKAVGSNSRSDVNVPSTNRIIGRLERISPKVIIPTDDDPFI